MHRIGMHRLDETCDSAWHISFVEGKPRLAIYSIVENNDPNRRWRGRINLNALDRVALSGAERRGLHALDTHRGPLLSVPFGMLVLPNTMKEETSYEILH